jgi:uncharacterized protein
MTLLTRTDAGTHDETHALFGQVMWLVAGAAGLSALGSYLGRHLSGGFASVFFILSFACLIAMRFTTRSGSPGGVRSCWAVLDSRLAWRCRPRSATTLPRTRDRCGQASGATALFMAGAGVAGYATRRDLSGIGRAGWWALLALIDSGVVMIFVNIPAGALVYSILGLVIFAALTMSDFQRLRGSTQLGSAPLIAASIFLDALNVFLFFLQLVGRNRDCNPSTRSPAPTRMATLTRIGQARLAELVLPGASSALFAVVRGEAVNDQDREHDVDEGPHRVVRHEEDRSDRADGCRDNADPPGDFRAGLVARPQDQYAGADEDDAGDQPYPPVRDEAVPEEGTTQAAGKGALVLKGPDRVDNPHDPRDDEHHRGERQPA